MREYYAYSGRAVKGVDSDRAAMVRISGMKPSYYDCAVKNLAEAEKSSTQETLFSAVNA